MTTGVRTARDVLADVVVELLVFCELAADDEMDPDTAVKLLEGAFAGLDELRASDRLWLVERIRAHAADDPHPERRRALGQLAEHLLEESP